MIPLPMLNRNDAPLLGCLLLLLASGCKEERSGTAPAPSRSGSDDARAGAEEVHAAPKLDIDGRYSREIEFKEIDEREFSAEKFNNMVRNEFILIARVLADTGLPRDMTTHATGLQRFFSDYDKIFAEEPFPLDHLAKQALVDV